MNVHFVTSYCSLYLAADDDAATMMEYALIVSLASIVISAVLPELRDTLQALFQVTTDGIVNAASGAAAV